MLAFQAAGEGQWANQPVPDPVRVTGRQQRATWKSGCRRLVSPRCKQITAAIPSTSQTATGSFRSSCTISTSASTSSHRPVSKNSWHRALCVCASRRSRCRPGQRGDKLGDIERIARRIVGEPQEFAVGLAADEEPDDRLTPRIRRRLTHAQAVQQRLQRQRLARLVTGAPEHLTAEISGLCQRHPHQRGLADSRLALDQYRTAPSRGRPFTRPPGSARSPSRPIRTSGDVAANSTSCLVKASASGIGHDTAFSRLDGHRCRA